MLEVLGLSKNFDSVKALDQIDLPAQEGEFLTLLGPSGCGKSTLLRCVAGFENPTAGQILWAGKSLAGVPPQLRPFHMVFQRHALFPHMTVEENIQFSLKVKNIDDSNRKKRVQELLEMMNLQGFEKRTVQTLSGGQSQRVALARALANHPKVLLLDEPLSALDEKIRQSLRSELKSLQKKLRITFIFVTHDQEEALVLSDRIAVFNAGKIEQLGTPEEVYSKPQSSFVAEFVGQKNKISPMTYLSYENLKLGSDEEIKIETRVENTYFTGRDYEIELKEISTGKIWKARASRQLTIGQNQTVSYSLKNIIQVPK